MIIPCWVINTSSPALTQRKTLVKLFRKSRTVAVFIVAQSCCLPVLAGQSHLCVTVPHELPPNLSGKLTLAGYKGGDWCGWSYGLLDGDIIDEAGFSEESGDGEVVSLGG